MLKPRDRLERWMLLYTPIAAILSIIPTVILWTISPEDMFTFEFNIIPKTVMFMALKLNVHFIFYLWIFIGFPLVVLSYVYFLILLKRKGCLPEIVCLLPLCLALGITVNDAICLSLVYLTAIDLSWTIVLNITSPMITGLPVWIIWRRGKRNEC